MFLNFTRVWLVEIRGFSFLSVMTRDKCVHLSLSEKKSSAAGIVVLNIA